jgi:cytochrome c
MFRDQDQPATIRSRRRSGGACRSNGARVEGYAYSDADKNSGIVWTEANFKEYLENPQEKMPGTKMILSVKNEKELADLWAFLKQFGADGKKKSQ